MVKFEQHFCYMRREAFKQYYIDYTELKKLIKAVSKNP